MDNKKFPELSQYIFPIYSGGTIVGQGFVADGYFITAAHVVKDFPSCFIIVKGKRMRFTDLYSHFHIVFIGEGDIYHDSKMMDVVMYSFDDIVSPLHLLDYIPEKGDHFNSYCMHEVMDFSSLNPSPKLKMVHAFARGEEEGNYFYCNCEQYGGSSGSPLLKGYDVVGIMHGGNNNGLCAFLKAQVVRQKISQKELSLDFDSWDLDDAIEYKNCKYSRDKKRLLKGTGDVIKQGTIVICNQAFYREGHSGWNYGLASGNIIIPNSVKKIGEKSFAYSKELESIEIPDSVVQIGKEAFECCTFLKRVVLSNSITEIPENMFCYCQSLSEITIPSSVIKIGMEAFTNCDSLTNLIIPCSVNCIESLAFWECKSLEQVIFNGLVSEIESDAFSGCESLSEIIIPAGTVKEYENLLPDYADMLIEDENITKGNIYLDWIAVGDKFTLEEICEATSMFSYGDILGDEAKLTEIELADGSTTLRIVIPFKDGTKIELKAGKGIQSDFADGDNIKVNLIYGQELHKIGQKSIVRYDVWVSEEQKNEYIRKREGE